MRVLYLDCSAGAAGDMILGALLDCGIPREDFQEQLSLLPLSGYTFKTSRVSKKGMRALQVKVEVFEKQPFRNFAQVKELISSSSLSSSIKNTGMLIFETLAQAEAKIHGVNKAEVHFHEIGAVDSIVDIMGSAIALNMLNIDEIWGSELPLGKGYIKTGHGTIPLPAPATMEILRQHRIPCHGLPFKGETVTPTGAAILGVFCSSFSPLPPLIIKKTGYGAGLKNFSYPNLLRAFIGETTTNTLEKQARENMQPAKNTLLTEQVEILEANIDDLNPEIYDYLMERLFEAGALDVFFTPVQMKKNRPAVKVTILSSPHKAWEMGAILLQETTTLGYRRYSAEKIMLPRRLKVLKTPWGKVRVKIAGSAPPYHNIAPEYIDCLQIAKKEGIPLKRVYSAIWRMLSSKS